MTTTTQPAALPESATVLPDGSAFAIASYPLPADHWLYAPREYRDGEDDPIELPAPILNHRDHGDAVRAAIRYAVRSATMCGKEEDFDPDALVQNAMYALRGPFGAAALHPKPAAEVSDEEISRLWSWSATAEAERTATTQQHAFAYALLAMRPQAVPMTDEQILKAMSDAGWPKHLVNHVSGAREFTAALARRRDEARGITAQGGEG